MQKSMKLLLASSMLAAAASAAPASATTLLNLVDLGNVNSAQSLTFKAGSASTTVAFSGYNLPAFIGVTGIGFYLNNAGPNLSSGNYLFTPAPSGSDAYSNGPDDLHFGSVVVGSYDTYSQAFATTVGSTYAINFNLANGADPSGFRVDASNALVGGVPEMATWAMMIMGFGVVGGAMRSSVRRSNVKFNHKIKAITEGSLA